MARLAMTSPSDRAMMIRFCGYTTLRNLRFFEPFFVLFLLLQLDLPYVAIGGVLAYEKVLIGILESPLGAATDRWGLRRGLITMFALTAAAYAVFGMAASSTAPLAWIWAGQTLSGIGEALRSGTHKAIMLDWLESRGQADRVTAVVGLTRVFSKTSAGVAAMVGGIMVWHIASFTPLFWSASVVCVLGIFWMISYPSELEGQWVRDARQASRTDVILPHWWDRLRRIFAAPGLIALLIASVVFETQVKLAMTYLQPYLARGVGEYGMVVIGGYGAIAIGSYYLVQGIGAGVSSSLSAPLETLAGGRERALRWAYLIATTVLCTAAACLWLDVHVAGVVGLLILACLQNARRPILIARLNELMDKYQRATTLSIESQARSWLYAILAVGTGVIADRWGLAPTFGILGGFAAAGAAAQLTSTRTFDTARSVPPTPPADV